MATKEHIHHIAYALPEVTLEPHFDIMSFRVRKKIFLSFNDHAYRITLKLNETDQSTFVTASNGLIYPVPNNWGKQGWTHLEFQDIHPLLLKDAIITSYCTVAPKHLTTLLQLQD